MIKKGKHIAVRPDKLIEARYDLTLKQNDILDMVLTQIEDDDNCLYELDIDNYSQLYTSKSIKANIYRDFKKAIKAFEGKGFYIIDKENNRERFFVWFASISYLDGEGRIVIELGKTLKQLLVKMKKKIFYKLEYPINFNSIYSKRIYYYLMSFKDTGWRIDKIDELRKKLQCPSSYDKYGLFRTKVLDKAYEEINNYSDISFEYEEIKTGRKVTAIKFYIHSNKKITSNDEIAATEEPMQGQVDFETQELLNQVKQIIKEPLSDKNIFALLKTAENDINKIQNAYGIAEQTKTPIDNLIAFLTDAIKKDYKAPVKKENAKKSKFANFKERNEDEFDWKKIEELARKQY